MSSISVVILNYNGRSYLEKFLPSVITYSNEAELIIIDNASTDDSIQFIEDHYPAIRIIRLERNLGFAGGYNAGLDSIETEYAVLLNSDIEVTANWLTPLVQLMDNDPSIAASQPKILDYNRKDHFEYAGACGGYIDWFGYPFCRGRIFDHLEKDEGQYDDTLPVFWASGACFFVRTKVFKQTGGFDEDFFAHMEEIDLCWRMHKQGYTIYVCPQSVVYHVGGGTLPVTNPRKTFLNFKNNLEMILKNKSGPKLFFVLPIRWLLDWAAIVKFLISGLPKHSWAVVRAQWLVLRNFYSIVKKRSYGKPVDRSLIFSNSIAYCYYLRGKTLFRQLNWK